MTTPVRSVVGKSGAIVASLAAAAAPAGIRAAGHNDRQESHRHMARGRGPPQRLAGPRHPMLLASSRVSVTFSAWRESRHGSPAARFAGLRGADHLPETTRQPGLPAPSDHPAAGDRRPLAPPSPHQLQEGGGSAEMWPSTGRAWRPPPRSSFRRPAHSDRSPIGSLRSPARRRARARSVPRCHRP